MSQLERAAGAVRLGLSLIAVGIAGACALPYQSAERALPQTRPPSAASASARVASVSRPADSAKPSHANGPPTLEENDVDLAHARRHLADAATAGNHRRLAEAYANRGVLDLAFDHFTAAVRLNRSDASSYDGLARVWRDWGFPHLGLSDAHRAVYYAPRSAPAHNTLGTVLLGMGFSTAAEVEFERALALEPAAAYAINNLCFLAVIRGDSRKAIDTCRRALDLRPNLRAARNNLALAYAAAGDFMRAQREFSTGGDTAAAAYNMGIAYMTTGHLDQAAAAFLLAWQSRAGFAEAGERLMQVDAMRAP